MIAGANITTILLMLLTGYSDRIDPVHHPDLSNINLIFPVFLFLNLCFLFFWLFFRNRNVWISLLGFIVCYVPVRKYFPINFPDEVPAKSIKVMSYNVFLFAGWQYPGTGNPILQYFKEQNPDILCLQESGSGELGQAVIDSVMDKIYPYKCICIRAGDCLSFYSKYRILSHQLIEYPSLGNMSAACRIKIDKDTVWVVNNHLETTGLSLQQRQDFKEIIKGEMKSDTAGRTSRKLISTLGESVAKRAVEADAVARFIHRHHRESLILCGDFNDGPISYTHRIIGRNLIDCYKETGNGPGISYHLSGFYVRIDNIMCTTDWIPYRCKVDSKIKASDHYPIYCWLKKRSKL